MAKKNENPYRSDTAYNKIFGAIRKSQIVTRNTLLKMGFTVSDVTVVLSPRADGISKRGGDCRGNLSAQGHIYFMDKLKKKKGEDQKFRLRWRKEVLAKLVRAPKKKAVATKTPPKAASPKAASPKAEVTA